MELLLASDSSAITNPIEQLRRLNIEELLLPVLIQLIVIIVVARAFGVLFRWLNQPTVVGEIVAGILMGPSVFGALFPAMSQLIFKPHLHGVDDVMTAAAFPKIFAVLAQLGLIFLLFLIGLEFEFSHLRIKGRAALVICLVGVLLPFGLGAALAPCIHGILEPHQDTGQPVPLLGLSLFLGTAMSITALPILGRMMVELGINRTKLAAVVITAAAFDDAAGWTLLATVASIVRSQFHIGSIILMISMTGVFLAGMFMVARPILTGILNKSLKANNGTLSLNAMAILLVTTLACAILTNLIGIFAIFGAFTLGAILSDQEELRHAINARMRDFVTSFFLPIFFTYTGLRTEIGLLDRPILWVVCFAVLAAAVIGKFLGCGLAARWTGFSSREATIVGVMMNTRALMELIVINVGYDMGVIPKSLFCMLVIMAITTTVITSPIILLLAKGTELEEPMRRTGFLKDTGAT